MNLISTIVIDDNELEAAALVLTLTEIGLFNVRKVFNSVREAKKWLQRQDLSIDIIFCDIEMDDINGIEARNLLKPYSHYFVFCTNHPHYSLQAFEVHADDYLLKSAGEERILELLDVFKERQKKTILHQIDYFMLDSVHKDTEVSGRRLSKVKIMDISHFKITGNYVFAYGEVLDRENRIFQKLGAFDSELKTFMKKYGYLNNLLQINGGEVLNMDWVDSSHLNVFKIKGVEFQVTETFKKDVKSFLEKYTPNAKK